MTAIDYNVVLNEIRGNRKRVKEVPGETVAVTKNHLIALCDIIEILIEERGHDAK